MFNDREVPIRIDVPVRREVVAGREVRVATVPDAGDEAPGAPRGNPLRSLRIRRAPWRVAALYSPKAGSKSDLVARGLNLGLCDSASDAAFSGGVSQDHLLRLLEDSDAPGAAERGYSLEDLAQIIESGSKVFAFVNAAELWNCVDEPSLIEANHAVLLEGVARDAQSDEIAGFFLRDPASSDTPVFVEADKIARMWLDAGGRQIVSAPFSL